FFFFGRGCGRHRRLLDYARQADPPLPRSVLSLMTSSQGTNVVIHAVHKLAVTTSGRGWTFRTRPFVRQRPLSDTCFATRRTACRRRFRGFGPCSWQGPFRRRLPS